MPKARRKDITDVLRGQYWLARVVFLRCLGFVYAAAFLSALRDNGALLGEDGLLPATRFMARVQQHLAHLASWEKVLKLPTVFWFVPPTAANLWWVAAIGAGVSCLVAARGAANLPAMFLLWSLYHSLVNVGQTWYSFGWESQLLETGFLAMFLVPWLSLSRFPEGSPASLACVWGYRWLLFRIMLGAGLIKMRGDPCWRDLTCMDYHYQTQPNPNPLSRYLHHLPSADWHKMEVVANHVVELVLPWCLLLTRRQRCFAGWVQILFQAVLVASGNLSFLNWLTAVPAVFSFDDLHLVGLFRPPVVRRLVRFLADTSSLGGEAGVRQVAANMPAPSERRRQEPGGEGEAKKGARGGGGVGGPGGGSRGEGSASSRPALLRTQSTLQWSSESEGEGEEACGATNDGDRVAVAARGDDGDDEGERKSMPSAVATAVFADDVDGRSDSNSNVCSSSHGQPRESFKDSLEGILRFRGRGGQGATKKPPPSLSSTPEDPAVGGGGGVDDGGGTAVSSDVGTSVGAAAGLDGPLRRRELGRASRAGGDSRPLGAAGGVLRGARRVIRWAADFLLVVLVVKGSVPVVKNMAGIGGGQRMNQTFDSLRIVNTYGNFGSVTKTRGEVILKGTRHPDPLDPAAEWKEYGFRCKPGDLNRRPCVISPLHYRLDWQMWFAAFQSYGHNPWLVNLVAKLLSREDDTRALAGSLIRHDPFSSSAAVDGGGDGGGASGPPLFIKADLYLYEFAAPPTWSSVSYSSSPPAGANDNGGGSADGRETGAWWTRRFVREYLPPVGLQNPSLHQFLASHGLGELD